MQTFANTGIKTEVIDEIISFAKKHDIHCVAVMEDDERNIGDLQKEQQILRK